MPHGRFWAALALTPAAAVAAQAPDADDEARDAAAAKRFQDVLEKNPRRGTALDRLYGHHVERGSLDKLIDGYAAKAAADGNASLIVGLLEAQRGRDAAAVAAFEAAEKLLPENALPGYYLGQSLILVGRPGDAAAAFERCISKKPNRNDLLDAFQALGRVYQRTQRTEKALAVWNRLESLFPDDPRVQEQITTTLVEEGQFDQALPRLAKLIAGTDDAYRKTQLRIDLAELKVKLKKTPEALADFEKLLAELNPDNWLYRDVRKRVEDVFLRADDLTGLAKYYESWLAKNPTDVEAVARLAKSLSGQGKAPEAKEWLEKGIKASPSSRPLRQALIDLNVAEQNWAAAGAQFEAMDKADPNNPDTLREWGKLFLKDTAKPEADRKAAAVAVWKKLLEKKPTDPVTTAQVADLLRGAGATDDAITLYKKAIELAPANPQYREYLGEYFHNLKRPADAHAAWRPIAEGANRTPANLTRLAEVFAGFGYRAEAIATARDAAAINKDDFAAHFFVAQLLFDDGQNEPSLTEMAVAEKLAAGVEDQEQILTAQIKIYGATDTLTAKAEALEKELAAGTQPTADRYHRLARYYEANKQLDLATTAITAASAKNAKSVPILASLARINEAAGNMLAAADANRKLADIDRRFRVEYLQNVAKLEQRLGRRDKALQAGKDVLAASPGNPDAYKFYADLCFALGENEEGLDALRRSVRANPADPAGLITLASAMSERSRTGEAVELLWRAFEKSTTLEEKLGVVDKLAHLYLEQNQFDKLLERLERERKEAERAREMTMCLAQAYSTAGDLGTARIQLERLLAENNRDTNLLTQLSSLCENEGDLPAAVKFQRQLVAAAPANPDYPLRLAQLLVKAGEPNEAADIWVKLAAADPDAYRNLQSIDQLVVQNKLDSALGIIQRLLAQKPGDWELVYREGAILHALGKTDEAQSRFAALLAMKLNDDEDGAKAKNEAKQKAKKGVRTQQAFARRARFDKSNYPPLQTRLDSVWSIRQACGLDGQDYYPGQQREFWTPEDYGAARIAAIGWKLAAAQKENKSAEVFKAAKANAVKPGADARTLWDWYYMLVVKNDYKDRFATAQRLADGNTPDGLYAYLSGLALRRAGEEDQGPKGKDAKKPLAADELKRVIETYRQLRQLKPDWVDVAVAESVIEELKLAGKKEDGDKLFAELLADATTTEKIIPLVNSAVHRDDRATATALFAKLDKLGGQPKTAPALAALPTKQVAESMVQLVGKMADAKKYPDGLAVFDLVIDTARRQAMAVPKTAGGGRKPGSGFQVSLYTKQNYRGNNNQHVAYPSANEYYDSSTLSFAYAAFDAFKKADVQSDLFAHARKKLAAAAGGEKLYLHLLLGYLHWWADEKDEALAELTQAAAAAPGDVAMVLEIAELRQKNNEPAEALALLDTVIPVDTQMMQRREQMAMGLAEKLGNIDRARQAAERLFGLRLDAETQSDLAGRMHRLGMHELAETILNRAQRQAGNKTGTLVRLMNQYQSQNQTDQAVAIARQILRKTPASSNPMNGRDDGDYNREQALRVIARSGQLQELIERAEAQRKVSPKSPQVLQSLAELYRAANDKAKSKDVLVAMAELKPDDARARFAAAQQLLQLGETAAACDQFKVAIAKEPALFSDRYWEIQNAFQNANRSEELAAIFDAIDLKKLQRYWTVMEIVQPLLQQDKTREMGLKLFRKAWAAFPDYRPYLLGNLYDDAAWKAPELYEYAKEALMPKEADEAKDVWTTATSIVSYGQEGRVDGVVTRMLGIARKQRRLPELRAEVEAVLKAKPEWVPGKALLAVIEIQSGRKAEGKKLWEEVFAKDAKVPALARFLYAQELEYYAGVEKMAVTALEAGIEEILTDQNYEYSYSPARRLVWWYEQVGRTAEAKALTLRAFKGGRTNPGYYPPGYWEYRQIQSGIEVANELLQKGQAVEAVQIFNDLFADRASIEAANTYQGGQRYEAQIEMGLRNAVNRLKPDVLPEAIGVLLSPRPKAGAGEPAIDLVLLVEPRDLTAAKLTSLFDTAAAASEKVPAVKATAEKKLAELAAKFSKDHSVAVAAALIAHASGDKAAKAKAVKALADLAEATPLEALPPNGKPNARMRAAALQQVPLWLAARTALADPELKPAAEKIGERALAAARRQPDTMFAAAILREWGDIAAKAGDKPAAEAKWTALLDVVLPPVLPKKAGAKPAPVPAPPAAPVPVPGGGPGGPPLTQISFTQTASMVFSTGLLLEDARMASNTDQFTQAVQLATLAADNGMPALSVKAVREALKAGPPVGGANNRNGRVRYIRTAGGMSYAEYAEDGGTADLYASLLRLSKVWKKLNVPPADVYAVVKSAVLVESRPAEVLLGTSGWTGGDYRPGMAELLAACAADAGKTAELKAELEKRTKQPLGELPARAALGVIAMKANDDAALTAVLKAFNDRIQKDNLAATANWAAYLVVPALERPGTAALAESMALKLSLNYAASNQLDTAANLGDRLVLHHIRRGETKKAKDLLAQAETLGAVMAGRDPQLYDRIGNHYLRAGFLADGLRVLAAGADQASSGGRDAYSNEPTLEAFPQLVRLIMKQPPAERYKLLKDWTLPTSGRRSVRYLVGQVPAHTPPAAFGDYAMPPPSSFANTLVLLAEAAKASGNAAELAAAADKAAAEKVEHGDLFRVLTHLALGTGKTVEPAVKAYSDGISARLALKAKPQNRRTGEGGNAPPPWPSEWIFTEYCLKEPDLLAHGERLLPAFADKGHGTYGVNFLGAVRAVWDTLGASRAGDAKALLAGLPPRWHSATAGATWFAQDGYLTNGWNDQDSVFLFDTPLAGTFEFSVDCYQGIYAEGNVGYAGVTFEANRAAVASVVRPVFRPNDTVAVTAGAARDAAFNRMTVRVTPASVTYSCNGKVLYEDKDPPTGSPWLMLYSERGRRPVFRNPTLTGTPGVPAEVKLLPANSLDGWLAHLYGGSLQQRLIPKEPVQEKAPDSDESPRSRLRQVQGAVAAKKEKVQYDFEMKDGELTGRKLESPTGKLTPAKIMYFRPLKAGEELRYQFFHKPGEFGGHPSLGRLAFLLHAESVKLRWLSEQPGADWTNLPATNAVPAGKVAVPLKADDWNAVTLNYTGAGAKIAVNGTVVFDGPLDPQIQSQFGFYFDRDAEALRVKDVVLKGTWKTGPVTEKDLAFEPPATTAAAAKARRWQLGEKFYFTEAGEVAAKAGQMPPAEAYAKLISWVLPTPTRPAFQLAGEVKPQDVLGGPVPKEGRRVWLGGKLESPALALVAAAKAANKLDELLKRVQDAEVSDDLARRGKFAMVAAVQAARGDDAAASAALASLVPFTEKMAADAHAPERWPDLTAVAATFDRPGCNAAVRSLVGAMSKNVERAMIENKTFEHKDWWVRQTKAARADVATVGKKANSFAHWFSAPLPTAQSRNNAQSAPRWTHENGVLTHHPGGEHDDLYFRVPLRGDFTVECGLRTQGWQEAFVSYGGVKVAFGHDRKNFTVVTTARYETRTISITPPMPPAKTQEYQFRLEVKGGVMTASVDGRVLHTERIGTDCEPWLVINSPQVNTGEAKNLRIAGSPTVPKELDLAASDSLPGWRNYRGEMWGKRGEEVFDLGTNTELKEKPASLAPGQRPPTRNQPERMLYYARPLAEDGLVEFDFYYEAGKSSVAPCLDRLAFLLDPKGVKLHRVTDGPAEKSGTPVDNETDEPTCRRGPSELPLKEKQWNRCVLEVVGDTVKVSLNGTPVYEREIESTNQRHFGLFHYVDRSTARVRDVKYRGAWGAVVPGEAELFK